MRNKVLCWLCICALLWTMAIPARAAGLSGESQCCLTLYYAQNSVGFEGLEIRIHRVAEVSPSGRITAVAPFDAYPVQFNGITSQQEWRTVAETLEAYIVSDGVAPLSTESTDASGKVVFAGLDAGVYLVQSVLVQNGNGDYLFDEFVIFLPAPQEQGEPIRHVEASPKCGSFLPADEYTVIKLWKDSGDGDQRPASVTVDILRDGVLQEQKVLSSENDWTYSWRVVGDQGKWTVVERDVPEGYQVTVTANGATFLITNVSTTPPEVPPTGDTSSLGFYIALLCVSGVALLILGTRGGRRKDDEKK